MGATTPYVFDRAGLPKSEKDLQAIATILQKHKLVKFPKAFPSNEERARFIIDFAPYFSWRVTLNDPEQVQFVHEETHEFPARASEKNGTNSEHDVIVSWHLEALQSKYPQMGSLWCMDSKTCPKTAGATGFVDVSLLCQMLPKEDYEFLSKCDVVQTTFYQQNENEEMDLKRSIQLDGDKEFVTLLNPMDQSVIPSYVRPAIAVHPHTHEHLLRLHVNGHYTNGGFFTHDSLLRFDKQEPSEGEILRFRDIAAWVNWNVHENEKLQYWHYWDEGDTLLIDIFSMAHSVRGGFHDGERLLRGIRAFPNTDDLPSDPEQINKFTLHQMK